ncbi:MAG: MFS transporter [Syntrophobacteraceae bacterium]
MRQTEKLFTFQFIALNLVSFFAFCNLSVFYSFYEYLSKLGIPAQWRGVLTGLEPTGAFLSCLTMIPLLRAGSAAVIIPTALALLVTALYSYSWAVTIPTLIVLRLFHGAAFGLLVSANVTTLAGLIPKQRENLGWGIASVPALILFAVMPLMTETLLAHGRTEPQIYAGITILAFPAAFLLLVLGRKMKDAVRDPDGPMLKRPYLAEMRRDFGQGRTILLPGIVLFLLLGCSTVFFFMKSHAAGIASGETGRFFAIAIPIALATGAFLGTLPEWAGKVKALWFAMLLLVLCFFSFGLAHTRLALELTAGLFGLCIGAFLPLLRAAAPLLSPGSPRGLRTNLTPCAMGAGFLLGPYLGGALIAKGLCPPALFNVCGGFLLICTALLTAPAFKNTRRAGAPGKGPSE